MRHTPPCISRPLELFPGKAINTSLVIFGIPVSKFPLTYRDDEVSAWGGKGKRDCLNSLTTTVLFNGIQSYCTALSHSLPHDVPPTLTLQHALPVLPGSNLS